MILAGDKALLIAPDEQAAELEALAPGRFAHCPGAYQALEELSRQPFASVVLSHPQVELPALVRALRRLGSGGKVYALCSPAGEADLRLTRPEGLDDYFLFPPAPQELAQILGEPAAPAETAAHPAALSPAEMGDLIESASNLESLTTHLAEKVQAALGKPVQWVDSSALPAGAEPLLLLFGDSPRSLVAVGESQVTPALREKLSAVQAILGALADNARRMESLHRLAITDHLTGAYNRRYFYHFTDQLLHRAAKERFRVTLLLYDIDDFKRYNETYGHAAGDEILREITQLMRQVTRKHDIVARIGGDEFTVLFWDAEPPRKPDSRHPQSFQDVARRFVQALRKHEFAALGPEAKGVLSISGGLASFPWDGKTCRELLRHADGALRQAKSMGKNAIYIIGQGPMQDTEE